jgi:hypothetical protein
MIGVSRTTLWRMVQAGSFPRPISITDASQGYLLESVEAWMRARAEGRPFDLVPAGKAQGCGSAPTPVRVVTRPAQRRAG